MPFGLHELSIKPLMLIPHRFIALLFDPYRLRSFTRIRAFMLYRRKIIPVWLQSLADCSGLTIEKLQRDFQTTPTYPMTDGNAVDLGS